MSDEHSKESPIAQFLVPERRDRLNRVASKRTRSLTIVLDRVANAHNISAVMRSADAFGIQELHLIGDEFAFSGGISLVAEQWLDIHRYRDESELIDGLRARGFRFVTLEAPNLDGTAEEQTIPVFGLPFDQKLALVFGNEHRGISDKLRASADFRAFIPMFGFVESFNISVAAAITMFCSVLGDVSGERAVDLLPEGDRKELFERWAELSVRDGAKIRAELERRKLRDIDSTPDE
ncbi:MAG: RNA methyltransferase [Deltaproteobacteria bacterium]|nr:RNA methyltransferase [Deltaproteobacteria bacterium]